MSAPPMGMTARNSEQKSGSDHNEIQLRQATRIEDHPETGPDPAHQHQTVQNLLAGEDQGLSKALAGHAEVTEFEEGHKGFR